MSANEKDLKEGYRQLANAISEADKWQAKATKFWPGFKQLLFAATFGHAKDALELNKESGSADHRHTASEFFNELAGAKDNAKLKEWVKQAMGKMTHGVWINTENTGKETLFLREFYANCITKLNKIDSRHLDGNGQEAYRAIHVCIEDGIPAVSAAITAERFRGDYSLPDLR